MHRYMTTPLHGYNITALLNYKTIWLLDYNVIRLRAALHPTTIRWLLRANYASHQASDVGTPQALVR
jgi:hypothetical protein